MTDKYNEQAAPVMETKTDRTAVIRSVPKELSMIVRAYLESISPEDPPTPDDVQDDLLGIIEEKFQRHNQNTEGTKLEIPKSLPWFVVSDLVFHLHVRKNLGNSVLNNAVLQKYIYAYNNSLTSSEVQETIKRIKSLVTMDSKGRRDSMEERIIDEFKHELLTNASLECIPTTLAYDMYLGWIEEKNRDPEQKQSLIPCGRNKFLDHLKSLVNPAKDYWIYMDVNQRVHEKMNYLEPLLERYHCIKHMKNPDSNNPLDHMTINKVPELTRGLFKL